MLRFGDTGWYSRLWKLIVLILAPWGPPAFSLEEPAFLISCPEKDRCLKMKGNAWKKYQGRQSWSYLVTRTYREWEILCVLIAQALSSPEQATHFSVHPLVASCNQVMTHWFDHMKCILLYYHAGPKCDCIVYTKDVKMSLNMCGGKSLAVSPQNGRKSCIIRRDPAKPHLLPAYDPRLYVVS